MIRLSTLFGGQQIDNALVSRPPVRDRRRQPGIPLPPRQLPGHQAPARYRASVIPSIDRASVLHGTNVVPAPNNRAACAYQPGNANNTVNSVEELVGMQLANIKQLAEATAGERISAFSSMSSSGAYGLYGPPLADQQQHQDPPQTHASHTAPSPTATTFSSGTQASMDAGANTVGGLWIGSSNSEATSGGVGSVPSYTPDPNAQPLSNGLGWSPSSSGGSKGPSGNSPSQTGSGQPSSSAADLEFGFVSPKATGDLKSVDTQHARRVLRTSRQ
ncbi:hypothetical protein CF328_g9217 [Tilletia controversa]|nr:hypothetical protein CF328_g9217 [Tilletia controversa]